MVGSDTVVRGYPFLMQELVWGWSDEEREARL
jgi:hypothetical protein